MNNLKDIKKEFSKIESTLVLAFAEQINANIIKRIKTAGIDTIKIHVGFSTFEVQLYPEDKVRGESRHILIIGHNIKPDKHVMSEQIEKPHQLKTTLEQLTKSY